MILDKIINAKKEELKLKKLKNPSFENLEKSEKNFLNALKGKDRFSIIAEIKKASPSQGLIDPLFNFHQIAQDYEDAGAACLSILTDEQFFQGKLSVMHEISQQSSLPILRKDFIIDEYQIKEARAYGADAILLIARILNDEQMNSFYQVAQLYEMDVLVEVHNEVELNRALRLPAAHSIIGINNRDLDTLTIDLKNTPKLLTSIPTDRVIVAESGYFTAEDTQDIKGKVDALLVGTSLMQASNKIKAIQDLTGSFIA